LVSYFSQNPRFAFGLLVSILRLIFMHKLFYDVRIYGMEAIARQIT